MDRTRLLDAIGAYDETGAAAKAIQSTPALADALAADPLSQLPITQFYWLGTGVDASCIVSNQTSLDQQLYLTGGLPVPPRWRLDYLRNRPIAPDGSERWPNEMQAPEGSGLTQDQWDQQQGKVAPALPAVPDKPGDTLKVDILHWLTQLPAAPLTADTFAKLCVAFGLGIGDVGRVLDIDAGVVNDWLRGNPAPAAA